MNRTKGSVRKNRPSKSSLLRIEKTAVEIRYLLSTRTEKLLEAIHKDAGLYTEKQGPLNFYSTSS
jgi:hypothetical protein